MFADKPTGSGKQFNRVPIAPRFSWAALLPVDTLESSARRNAMPKRRLSEQKLADKPTAISVAHLDTLSPEERESRIRAFEKKVEQS
jgi:hypothetical protein